MHRNTVQIVVWSFLIIGCSSVRNDEDARFIDNGNARVNQSAEIHEAGAIETKVPADGPREDACNCRCVSVTPEEEDKSTQDVLQKEMLTRLPSLPDDNETIVDGITLREIRQEIHNLPPYVVSRYRTDAGKYELISKALYATLFVREAYRRGYDKRPELRQKIAEAQEKIERRIIARALLNDSVQSLKPTEKQLREYFASHSRDFESMEAARVISVAAYHDGELKEKIAARNRALEFHKRLTAGEEATAVARDGEGPEKNRGGDLGWREWGELRDLRLQQAAFQLEEPGDISPVVQVEGGYAVLVLRGKRGREPAKYDKVRGSVRDRWIALKEREMFELLTDELKKKYDTRGQMAKLLSEKSIESFFVPPAQ